MSRLPMAVLVLACLLQDGVCARFAGSPAGRLAPGPSVEDDNPLPAPHAGRRRCAEMPVRVLRQVLGPAFNEHYMALSAPPFQAYPSFGPFQSAVEQDRVEDDQDEGHSGTRVLKDAPWAQGSSAHPVPSEPPSLPANGESSLPFYVDEDFQAVLSDEPAWNIKYEMELGAFSSTSSSPSSPRYGNYRTGAGRREVMLEGEDAEYGGGPDEHPRNGRAAKRVGVGSSLLPRNMQWHCESPLRWVDLGPDYFPRYLRSADCGHSACRSDQFVCRPRSFTVKVLRRREGMCAPAGDVLGANLHEESSVGLPHELRDLWVWELRAINFCCVCHVR